MTKVRVVNGADRWWYKDKVGEEFEVVQIDGKPSKSEFYFLVKRDNEELHIKINDAELVGKPYIRVT